MIRIVYILSVLFLVQSCVPRKKYNSLVSKYEEQAIVVDSLKIASAVLKQQLISMTEVSGSEYDMAFITSVQSTSFPLFRVDPSCRVSNNQILSQLGSAINDAFIEKPIAAVQNNELLINSTTKKLYFIASGRSSILTNNTFYETVIYIVTIYNDQNQNIYACSVDFVPLISAGQFDEKQFLYSDDQIASYIRSIRGSMEAATNQLSTRDECLILLK